MLSARLLYGVTPKLRKLLNITDESKNGQYVVKHIFSILYRRYPYL